MKRGKNTRLAALLNEAGWNTTQLLRAVTDLAFIQGIGLSYDRTAPAHWLNGSQPRPPVPHLVAEALSQRLHRIVTASETGLIDAEPVPEQQRRPVIKDADGVELLRELVQLCRSLLDPQHGPTLASGVYVSQAPPLPGTWTTQQRGVSPDAMARSGSVVLHYLTNTFAALILRHGGAQARPMLVSYLAHGIRPEYVRADQQLLKGYAQLAHLLALCVADTGHFLVAQRAFDLSLAISRSAMSRTTWAITTRAMSTLALEFGYRAQARSLADLAVDETEAADGAVRSFVTIQRSLVHAAEGESSAAVAAMERAQEAWEAAPLHSAGPFTAYPRPGLDYQRFRIWQAIGESHRALSALEDAIHCRSTTQRRPCALLQADLAEALYKEGMINPALMAWATFLDHCPFVWSIRLDQAVNRMRAALASWPTDERARTLLRRARALDTHAAAPQR